MAGEEQGAAPFEPYLEEEPTIGGWLREHLPTRHDIVPFITSFFPFTSWIGRYNSRWLLADAIAGVTLGLVVIPQAMAYALLAGLSPEYGLYTSFTGATLYWLFGTSKDVAIGATAVVSLLVGKTVNEVLEQQPDQHYTREQVARTHAFLAGCVLLVFGLLRLDWLIEFIPHVAIAAFITGAAFTISLSQVPALLGVQAEVNSKNAPYRVFVDTCRALPHTNLDAAIGVSGLVLLALIKWYCNRMEKRDLKRVRMWNMFCSLRLSVTILLFTFVSFLVHRKVPFEDSKFRILGQLPRGTHHASAGAPDRRPRIKFSSGFIHNGPPSFHPKLIMAILPQLPPTVIILLIEHIAIGKSFGRINEYTVVPSQELISIAFTNLTGPFVGAYASTGSFSGTAILSKAGVRTPLAGVFNGFVLVLALYALTSILYYIPLASLSALIIHAVYNLITPPAELIRMWHTAPPDLVFFFVGVLVAIFDSLEDGIYVTVALSLALLLLRIAKSSGQFLGRVTVYPNYHHSFAQDKPSHDAAEKHNKHQADDLAEAGSHGLIISTERQRPASPSKTAMSQVQPVHQSENDEASVSRLPLARDAFFRLDRGEAINPRLAIISPYPGVFAFRFPNGFNYINQAQLIDTLANRIMSHTRRTTVPEYAHPGDRPWNEPSSPNNKSIRMGPAFDSSGSSPRSSSTAPTSEEELQPLPTLRAVVLDCATINHTDSGAIEGLAELRAQLDRWAAPSLVEWHFAHLRNGWTRKAFAANGFGCCNRSDGTTARPGFSLAARYESEAGGVGGAVTTPPAGRVSNDEESCGSETEVAPGDGEDIEVKSQPSEAAGCPRNEVRRRLAPVTAMDRPYFHADLAAAVEAATRHASASASHSGCVVGFTLK
ncbi:sulfate permease [Apiospora marii]|uniref:Sulfate permease n=1 Tax=Apiospora marii TaxID=335849 RepID=A0ABR1RTM4_9PEZI